MRRLIVPIAVLVVALACAGAAQPAVTFILKGKGWGHGIGLSQYGAYGFARDAGWSFQQILAHYYPGTTLANRSRQIEVLLTSNRSSLTIGSDSSFSAGAATVGAGTWTASRTSKGRIKLVRGGVTHRVPGTTTFEAGGSPLELDGAKYRGTITLRRSGNRIWALNALGLDAYVKGVVPREMPSSWHMEALKAQAVAARSYALAAGGHCSWFGRSVMCKDTSDQVYGGLGGEASRTNTAVDQTARDVLLFGGSVASTFFFSTSGGKTAAIDDEWGSPPRAYLVSVSDPHDRISPHHAWGPRDAEDDCPGAGRDCVWSGKAMQRLLGGPAGLRNMTVRRNDSSRVSTVRAVGRSATRTLTGASLRSTLGLRSTWFTIGVLRLTGGGAVDPGERRVLSGYVRHVSNVSLQRKRAGGAWTTVKKVSGTFKVRRREHQTTSYRLASPSGSTAPVRIRVRPRVAFAAAQRPGALAGVVRGGDATRSVQVQRRTAAGWTTVAVAFPRPDGSWRVPFDVQPGVYRAYVAPHDGVGPAASTRLTVVSG